MSEQPNKGKKLADQVLDRLFGMIEAREIAPGGLLPSERQLMLRFEVGRPAVREALQALANMGLVQIRHGGRARLLELQPRDVFEQMDQAVRRVLLLDPDNREYLREARLMFESAMVRLAAARATGDEARLLREALMAQQAAVGDAAQFVRCDIAFHNAIARVSHNPIFVAVSAALLEWAFAFSPRLLRAPNTEELTLAEHAAILTAIELRDPDGAVFALRAHLTRSDPRYAEQTQVGLQGLRQTELPKATD